MTEPTSDQVPGSGGDFDDQPPAELMSLKKVQGEHVRQARQDCHLRQEEVAALASNLGLKWSQTTVASIEAGKRDLSLVEGLFLANVLKVEVKSLLLSLPDVDKEIEVGTSYYLAADWDRWVLIGDRQLPPVPADAAGIRKWAALADKERLRREAVAAIYGLDGGGLLTAVRGAILDAEIRAARRLTKALQLRIEPWEVALASMSIWGQTLSDQRDKILRSEGLTQGERKTSARAGWITRELEKELEQQIAAVRRPGAAEEPAGGPDGSR